MPTFLSASSYPPFIAGAFCDLQIVRSRGRAPTAEGGWTDAVQQFKLVASNIIISNAAAEIKSCTTMLRSRDRFVAVATILAIYQGRLLPSNGFCSRTLPNRPRHPQMLAPLLANNNEGVKFSRESSSPSLSPFRQFEDEVLDRIAHAQENGDNSSST